MTPLAAIAARRPGDGFNARDLIRADRHWAGCWTCRKKHPLRPGNEDHDYADFAVRHPAGRGCVVLRLTPDQVERAVRRAERRRRRRHDAIIGFSHNASVLEAFQASDQSVDLTAFNSLASSATAGWSSHYVDNSSNLYLDLLFYVKIAAVNTAPASDKCFYFFAASALNTTDLPTSGASTGNTVANSSTTSAALTFPSVSTLPCLFPQVYRQDYPVQNVANVSPLFSFARPTGGFLGLYNWLPMVNFSGMTIAASGNVIKYRGVYNTVA